MREGANPILALRGVSKQFELQGERIEALRDANLRVRPGEFVCLIGASGCGKSTLLRIVAGFETATRGQALMWDRPITGPGPERGMVFQDYGLFPWLTVRANIGFGPSARGRPAQEVKETVERFITMVGLQRFADAYPHQLSGGMKQRVGIARALAIDPKVLLMDEPFGALDAQTRESLQAELLDLHRRTQKTILFVTHDLDEAVLIADRIVVMKNGRVQEIMDVPLKRPRPDLGVVRGAPEFAETRYRVWRAIHDGAAVH